jgi:deoxyribodipyrimidine photo-lyase
MRRSIWWIRRDLRLHDNPALEAALQNAQEVIPVFILDPKLLASPYVGDKRLAFLFAGLQVLDADLQNRGGRLIIRQGEPGQVLQSLAVAHQAERVFAQEDFSPYARVRDARAAQLIDLTLTPGVIAHHPTQVLKDDGTPYTVFTPFSRKWKSLVEPGPPLPAPNQIPVPSEVESDPLPAPPALEKPLELMPGEAAALGLLDDFVGGPEAPIYDYNTLRNRVDLSGTSMLSRYFRFGMLSARQAIGAAQACLRQAKDSTGRKGAETWLNELIWREFFTAILYHFPQVRVGSFRKAYQNLPWENDEAQFADWCAGQTGYPIVDAAMRQLSQSGFMHNRARMIVASFLTKDLLIDWRWGERWFMQHLLDGDPAANNGGWQWSAGTGTDAAPYFRIFNPITQSKKHDPEGTYIRRWVPELEAVPLKFLHEPWTMPAEAQQRAYCQIGEDYPAPIIDHAWARERTLAAYKVGS